MSRRATTTSADTTDDSPMIHPTDRWIPAAMTTNVCNNPIKRTRTIAIRIFCEFRIVRKLTSPRLWMLTLAAKKAISPARNTQAHTRLKTRTNCLCRADRAGKAATVWLLVAIESHETVVFLARNKRVDAYGS